MAKPNKGPITDLSIVLLSFLLGFLLWIIIRHQDTEISTIPVQVKVENAPPYIEISDFQPKQLLVLFSFRRADELMIGQADRFTARLDLSSLESRRISSTASETITLRMNDEQIGAPDEVRLIRFKSPREITVQAKLRVLKARVEPLFINSTPPSPQSDFFIDFENVIVEPQEIEVAVSEERQRFENNQELVIQTEPIDLANRTRNLTGVFKLNYDNEQGIYRIPQVGQESVDLILDVLTQESSVTFTTVPVYVEPMSGIAVINSTPRTVDVTVTGPRSLISALTKDQILIQPREKLTSPNKSKVTTLEVGLQASYSIEDPNLAQSLKSVLSSSIALIEFVPEFDSTNDPNEFNNLLAPILPILGNDDQPSTDKVKMPGRKLPANDSATSTTIDN